MKHRNQLFHHGMVVVMALNILACGSAYAHSKQEATFPEDGAVLAAAPDVVSMTFDTPMRVTTMTSLDLTSRYEGSSS